MSTTARVPTSPTSSGLNVYDGYATIRSRGLYRQRSICVKEDDKTTETLRPTPIKHRQRKRTLSLKSNFSQNSNSSGIEDYYVSSRQMAKPVRTPIINDLEPIYASSQATGSFRPLSDASSSSGGGSNAAASQNEYQNLKKNLRFSLDSLHSSVTPKTPDCEAELEENENIFLYTAPKSPKRIIENCLTQSYMEPPIHNFTTVPKHSFEMNDLMGTSSPYKRNSFMSNSVDYTKTSPSNTPPMAPTRRESLYASPLRFSSTLRSPSNNSLTPLEFSQSPSIFMQNRSSSTEILERSHTSQSLATIDQDEILVVPTAMPMLQSDVDKRYHTLGHMRVQSLGTGLHRTYEFPNYGYQYKTRPTTTALKARRNNQSAGNIYSSADEAIADLNRLAPEYVDPLDFKIGCQTTLRSKPIIPWYELAIRRDLKRKSLPAISGNAVNKNNYYDTNIDQSTNNNQVIITFAFRKKIKYH